jgi:hypothetical protein
MKVLFNILSVLFFSLFAVFQNLLNFFLSNSAHRLLSDEGETLIVSPDLSSLSYCDYVCEYDPVFMMLGLVSSLISCGFYFPAQMDLYFSFVMCRVVFNSIVHPFPNKLLS